MTRHMPVAEELQRALPDAREPLHVGPPAAGGGLAGEGAEPPRGPPTLPVSTRGSAPKAWRVAGKGRPQVEEHAGMSRKFEGRRPC